MLGSTLYLKSREFWVRRTHQIGLCILKPENVSRSCRDIIVSMLWEMNFYFPLLCVHVSTFWSKNIWRGGGRASPAPLHATGVQSKALRELGTVAISELDASETKESWDTVKAVSVTEERRNALTLGF